MKKTAIVGAGISGLSLGWFLKKKEQGKLFIFEEKERAGGLIQTVKEKDFLFECGPRGFRSSGKGRATLQLIKELGLEKELIVANKSAKKRYLYQGGKLHLFSPLYLFKKGALKALFKDLTFPKTQFEDESIAHFTQRRLGTKFLENVIEPLVLGIYAGDPKMLSMSACFPKLWMFEKNHRSIVKGFFKMKKEKAELFSFQEGMQTLTEALSKELSDSLFLNMKVQKIEQLKKGFLMTVSDKSFEVDRVISAVPDFVLAKIFSREPVFSPSLTVSVVSAGWHEKELSSLGYGFLVPSSEKKAFLGMTNDGEIFKKKKEIRLSVMIAKETDKEKLKEIALAAIEELFHLKNPDAISIHTSENAISQYCVGHLNQLKNFRKSLPENFYVMGRSFDGVGVNDCIDSALKLTLNL